MAPQRIARAWTSFHIVEYPREARYNARQGS
jgi:hypothetical protein